ncbi:unnamed protein product, partial [Prorocentrum cordatum]
RRRGQRARRRDINEPGFLRKLAVTAAPRKRCEQCYAAVARAVGRLPKKDDCDAWGRIMVDYAEDLYRAGDTVTAARYAFHGVALVNDWPRRSPDLLPKTRLSILAFARSPPERCRDPPAIELVLLVLNYFLDRAVGEDCLRMALMAAHGAISFDCYLRPSEGLEITAGAVGRPRRGAAAQGWTINVAPAGVDAKPAVVCEVLELLVADLQPNDRVFRMLKLPDLEKEYRAASGALGFRAVPHGLRHAGPSHDAVVHKVKIEDGQARGRWASLESCRVYTKPATLVRSLNAVSDDLLDRAGALKATFSRRLLSVLREGLGVSPSRGGLKR